MTFGLEEKHWQLLQRLLIDPLKKRGVKVWIFGSRAIGTHKKYSDIDVLFEAAGELPPAFIGQLEESIENSGLPYKVDLVSIDDLAESYRENVNRQRVLL